MLPKNHKLSLAEMWVCFEKPDYFPNKVQLQNTEMTRINHELFCNALKHTWAIQLVDLSQDPSEKLVGACLNIAARL